MIRLLFTIYWFVESVMSRNLERGGSSFCLIVVVRSECGQKWCED